jgi:hypothetical protein
MSVWGKNPYLKRFSSKHNISINSKLRCTHVDISRFKILFDDPTVENQKNYVLKRQNIEVDTRWIDGVGMFERVMHKVA